MDEGEREALGMIMKREVRARRRQVRGALPKEARAARSAAIGARVIALPEWAEARTVLAFISMPTEVQTATIVEAARAAGKEVVAPRMAWVDGDPTLELREWRVDDPLEESGMMFDQPSEDSPVIARDRVDLVLVPALAYDERGQRIGFGKGYYDRLLPTLERAFRVGVIFDFERIAEVPVTPTDVPVQVVVTDARTMRVEAT